MSSSHLSQFENELRNLSLSFTKNEINYQICLRQENFELFQTLIKQYGMQYSNRDTNNYDVNKSRILWNSALVSFSGVPYVIQKVQLCHCANGPKYFDGKKSKKSSKKVLEANAAAALHAHSNGKSTRFRLRPSKKIGCNATMKVVLVKQYSEYKITGKKNLDDEKREIMKRLKAQLMNDADSIVTENIYHISFSLTTQHSHLVCTTFMNQELHYKLKEEIKHLVNSGITDSPRSISRESPNDSEELGVVSATVVPSSESKDSSKNLIPISEFQELMKTLYDRSFLMTGDSVDSSLTKKATELANLMNQYIDIDRDLNIFVLSVSDLPR